MMRQQKQDLGIPLLFPSKKTTIQRQFYVCFCAKIYNSYSALYLHAKKKHDQSINMKCLKHKKHEWSGNVKNIYYQFVEEEQQGSDGAQKQQEDAFDEQNQQIILQKYKKNRKSQSKSSSNSNKSKELKIKIQQNFKDTNERLLSKQQELEKIFLQYFQHQKNQKNSIKIIGDFLNFIIQSYAELKKNQILKQYFECQSFDFLPHCMNSFYMFYTQKNKQHVNECIKELLTFADWLYNKCYTRYLAIEEIVYCKFFQPL